MIEIQLKLFLLKPLIKLLQKSIPQQKPAANVKRVVIENKRNRKPSEQKTEKRRVAVNLAEIIFCI